LKAQLSGSFLKSLTKTIEGYEFEVGVLQDKPHKLPVESPLFGPPNLREYAGGQIRPTSGIASELSIGDVLIENMKRLGINLLLEPFQNPDSELNRFTTAFLRFAAGKKGTLRRVENLLQAVVRNPILRQEYGNNKGSTADNKGFDRHLFDTGQMFKAIKARAKRV
jgi:hypothetical protein